MYPYMNEEVAWQRLRDLQREMENSRRLAEGALPDWIRALVWVAARAVALVRRPARPAVEAEADAVSSASDEASAA